jgi:hypothetical protein
MSKLENHQDSQKLDEDLAFSPEELGPAPISATERWGSFSPPPPSYPAYESYEMRTMPPQNSAIQGQGAPGPPKDEPFNFGFFKPKKDARRKYLIALIIFLIAVIATLTTVFSVLAHKKKVEPVPQNITFTATLSTVMVSTQVTTQPTTLVQSSTIFQSTTLTQTTTTTSLLPNPTSVNKCWEVLANICANTTQVPANTNTGDFGDCNPVLSVFYCGLVQQFNNKGIFIIPADESPICGGMRDFCQKIEEIGNTV